MSSMASMGLLRQMLSFFAPHWCSALHSKPMACQKKHPTLTDGGISQSPFSWSDASHHFNWITAEDLARRNVKRDSSRLTSCHVEVSYEHFDTSSFLTHSTMGYIFFIWRYSVSWWKSKGKHQLTDTKAIIVKGKI